MYGGSSRKWRRRRAYGFIVFFTELLSHELRHPLISTATVRAREAWDDERHSVVWCVYKVSFWCSGK